MGRRESLQSLLYLAVRQENILSRWIIDYSESLRRMQQGSVCVSVIPAACWPCCAQAALTGVPDATPGVLTISPKLNLKPDRVTHLRNSEEEEASHCCSPAAWNSSCYYHTLVTSGPPTHLHVHIQTLTHTVETSSHSTSPIKQYAHYIYCKAPNPLMGNMNKRNCYFLSYSIYLWSIGQHSKFTF